MPTDANTAPVDQHSQCFDIYGYRVQIHCKVPDVLNGLADDFAFFASEARGDEAAITLMDTKPEYGPWRNAKASAYTPRNVAYRVDGLTIIDYSGRGVGIHDHKTGSFHLSSLDQDLLYEAAYLFLLSQSGEAFDRNHLHRVHALGVSVQGRAALILLPMGGGKSTLGSALLKHPEIQLLSDDAPLLDRDGNIHAFPLRIGLLPGSEANIPPDQLRKIQRMEFGPKLLVNYKYFADRVAAFAEPALVLLGERSLNDDCTLERASTAAGWKAMLTNCVIGLGLFQGMEFVFGRGLSEIAAKLVVAGDRLLASHRLLGRSEVYHLKLGRDSERNAEVVLTALRRSGKKWSGDLEGGSGRVLGA